MGGMQKERLASRFLLRIDEHGWKAVRCSDCMYVSTSEWKWKTEASINSQAGNQTRAEKGCGGASDGKKTIVKANIS